MFCSWTYDLRTSRKWCFHGYIHLDPCATLVNISLTRRAAFSFSITLKAGDRFSPLARRQEGSKFSGNESEPQRHGAAQSSCHQLSSASDCGVQQLPELHLAICRRLLEEVWVQELRVWWPHPFALELVEVGIFCTFLGETSGPCVSRAPQKLDSNFHRVSFGRPGLESYWSVYPKHLAVQNADALYITSPLLADLVWSLLWTLGFNGVICHQSQWRGRAQGQGSGVCLSSDLMRWSSRRRLCHVMSKP